MDFFFATSTFIINFCSAFYDWKIVENTQESGNDGRKTETAGERGIKRRRQNRKSSPKIKFPYEFQPRSHIFLSSLFFPRSLLPYQSDVCSALHIQHQCDGCKICATWKFFSLDALPFYTFVMPSMQQWEYRLGCPHYAVSFSNIPM